MLNGPHTRPPVLRTPTPRATHARARAIFSLRHANSKLQELKEARERQAGLEKELKEGTRGSCPRRACTRVDACFFQNVYGKVVVRGGKWRWG